MAHSNVLFIAHRSLTAGLTAWLIFGSWVGHPRAQGLAIAIVVNVSNTEERMTSAELCDVLLGERQRWPNGNPIQVFVPPPGSPEWTIVLRGVCRTSEAVFRRQVASSRAFGRASRPPQVVASGTAMKARVAVSPRAIGFVSVGQLDSSVKALLVDGLSPSDRDYPVQAPAGPPP